MTKDEFEFTKRKKNLIEHMVTMRFEERLYDELLEKDFDTIEELDAYFDAKLRQYDIEQAQIRDYYNGILAQYEASDEDDEDD